MKAHFLATLAIVCLGCSGVAHAQAYPDADHPVHVRSYYKPSTGGYIPEHWRALPNSNLYGAGIILKDFNLPHMPVHDKEEDEFSGLNNRLFAV
jgi:hypothetical protein